MEFHILEIWWFWKEQFQGSDGVAAREWDEGEKVEAIYGKIIRDFVCEEG